MGHSCNIEFITISTFINFHHKTTLCVYICTHWVFGCCSNNYQNNLYKFLQRSPAIIGFSNFTSFNFTFTISIFTFSIYIHSTITYFPKITKCNIDPTNDESPILQRSNHQRIHWLTIIHVHLARVHSGNQLIHDHSLLHHVQIFHLKLALPPLTRFQLSLMLHSIHFQIRLDLYIVVVCICYCLWEAWALAVCIGRLAAVVSLGLPQHITSLRWVTTSKETEHDAWLALIVAISNDCQGHWRAIHYAPARLQTHMSWLCTDVTCHLAVKWVVYDITHQILVKTIRLLAVKSTHNNEVSNEKTKIKDMPPQPHISIFIIISELV